MGKNKYKNLLDLEGLSLELRYAAFDILPKDPVSFAVVSNIADRLEQFCMVNGLRRHVDVNCSPVNHNATSIPPYVA